MWQWLWSFSDEWKDFLSLTPVPSTSCFSLERKLLEWIRLNGTAHFFAFSLIIEDTTEKVLQFIMPLESIYSGNFGFIEQKMYFWTLQRVSSKKNIIVWHYFYREKKSVDLLRAAPYIAALALQKDVLFHSKIQLKQLWNAFFHFISFLLKLKISFRKKFHTLNTICQSDQNQNHWSLKSTILNKIYWYGTKKINFI